MKQVRLLPDTEGLPRLPGRSCALATTASAVARDLFMAIVGHYASHRHKVMPEALCCALQGLQAVRDRGDLHAINIAVELFCADLAQQWVDVFVDPDVLLAYGAAQRFVKYSLA